MSLNDLRISSAVRMVEGQLQWENHGAAHEIFMVKKSLYLNIHQKPLTRDHQSSSILHRKRIITENDEKGRSSAVAGGGGGRYFSLQRYLSFIGA